MFAIAVPCGRYVDALWTNDDRSTRGVWLRGSGWRKLDDRNDDACTNLLAIAAEPRLDRRAWRKFHDDHADACTNFANPRRPREGREAGHQRAGGGRSGPKDVRVVKRPAREPARREQFPAMPAPFTPEQVDALVRGTLDEAEADAVLETHERTLPKPTRRPRKVAPVGVGAAEIEGSRGARRRGRAQFAGARREEGPADDAPSGDRPRTKPKAVS